MTRAPFSDDTAAKVGESLRHVVTLEAVTAGGTAYALDLEDGTLTFDERTAPRVELVATGPVPELAALEALDPRLGARVHLSAGYVLPGGARDVHQLVDLGLRRRRVRRPDNVLELVARSDEALAVDNSPVWGASVSASSPGAAIAALIRQAVPDATVSNQLVDDTATSVSDIADRWTTVEDIADNFDADVYDNGLRTFVVEPRPTLASRASAVLRVGPGGTIIDSDAALDRDDFANVVKVRYRWTDAAGKDWTVVGIATHPNTSPLGPANAGARVLSVDRETPATTASANKVATTLLKRAVSRSRSYTLSAVSAYWLRPGHTATVLLPTGGQERHLVSSVRFDLAAGRMTVNTRLPDDATTTTGE